ncbi:hypothetical protein [Mesorhizobium koreense]|uniref:hypothetical protein n=1 Tax=Mesorhizobium koreense TaxID=3074855 RepID=UPI00287B9FD6|nr:hypothetical protein [Mesorhizobium sp. WR6]
MIDFTPLCPAGHLPLKGGDRFSSLPPSVSEIAEKGGSQRGQLISPLEGEMSGRTEEGNTGRYTGKMEAF